MKKNCNKYVTGKVQYKTLYDIANLSQRYVEIKIGKIENHQSKVGRGCKNTGSYRAQ